MDGRFLFLYLKTCTQTWLGIYLFFCLLFSIPIFMIHVAVVGGLLCGLSFLRLPPPDPLDVFKLLGSDPRNLDGSPVRRGRGAMGLVARRCAGLDAPENTLVAAKRAKTHGAKFVHFNVDFTFDGVAVVSARSDITTKTFADLLKVDAAEGHVLFEKFSPEKIPKVEELVELCLSLELKMIIEVGGNLSADSAEKVSRFVIDLFKKEPRLFESAVLMSCWPHIVYMVRTCENRIVSALCWRPGLLAFENYSPNPKELCPRHRSTTLITSVADSILCWAVHDFLWYFLGISAIFVAKDFLSPAYIQRWRERGVRLVAFTVNSSVERAYLERCLGVSCMSDTLDELPIEHIIKDD